MATEDEFRDAAVRLAAGVIGLMRFSGYSDEFINDKFQTMTDLDDNARAILRDAFARADTYDRGEVGDGRESR